MGSKNYNHYKSYMENKNPGGYRQLAIYQQSVIIYDFTVAFTDRYIKSFKNKEQMNGAARSSKQCIAEAYLQKSMEGRLKLLGVTRGSNEELLNDYEDFLRQNGHTIWEKDNAKARKVRDLAYKSYKDYSDYKRYIQPPEAAANAMICLINQTNRLLDQKYRWLEERFVKEGGFREKLFKKRVDYRNKKK